MNYFVLFIIIVIIILILALLLNLQNESFTRTGYYLISWVNPPNSTVDNYNIIIKDTQGAEIINETVTDTNYKFINPNWDTQYNISITAQNKFGNSDPATYSFTSGTIPPEVSGLQFISPIDNSSPSVNSMNMAVELAFKSDKDLSVFDAKNSSIILNDADGNKSKCQYNVDMTSPYSGKPYKYRDEYLLRFQMGADCGDGFKLGQQLVGNLVLENEFGKTETNGTYTIETPSPSVPQNINVEYKQN
jgi:hypothetical protein